MFSLHPSFQVFLPKIRDLLLHYCYVLLSVCVHPSIELSQISCRSCYCSGFIDHKSVITWRSNPDDGFIKLRVNIIVSLIIKLTPNGHTHNVMPFISISKGAQTQTHAKGGGLLLKLPSCIKLNKRD